MLRSYPCGRSCRSHCCGAPCHAVTNGCRAWAQPWADRSGYISCRPDSTPWSRGPLGIGGSLQWMRFKSVRIVNKKGFEDSDNRDSDNRESTLLEVYCKVGKA